MEDSEIIRLYWARNQRAVEETEKKYRSYCSKIAGNILTDTRDTEECVSDTWMRAWNSIPPNRPVHLKIFLAKITRNLAIDMIRKSMTAKRGGDILIEELDQCLPNSESLESVAELSDLTSVIQDYLSTVPKRDRSVFLYRYFWGESTRDICTRFHLREENVHVILSRVRRRGLKLRLESEGYNI